MSQKAIDKLIELALESIKKGVSKDEALTTFIKAGILDNKTRFTKPYKHLETVVKSN